MKDALTESQLGKVSSTVVNQGGEVIKMQQNVLRGRRESREAHAGGFRWEALAKRFAGCGWGLTLL